MKTIISTALCFALNMTLSAQILQCNNDAVAAYAKTQGSQALVMLVNRAQNCSFDLKPSAVKALQASNPNITDEVISAMEQKMEGGNKLAASQGKPTPNMAPIQADVSDFGKMKIFVKGKPVADIPMENIDSHGPTSKQRYLTGNPLKGYHPPAQDRTVPGSEANTRIPADSAITFASMEFSGTVQNSKLVRARLKGNDRFLFETTMGNDMRKYDEVNVNRQSNNGTVIFTPTQPLSPGQYCFVAHNNLGVWCFDITDDLPSSSVHK